MHNKKHTWALLAFIISTMPFISTEVSADGGLDGSKDIVCSVQNVMACVNERACVQGIASEFELPEFIILDIKKKILRAAYESGHKEISPVKKLEKNGQHLILQGVENSRGWDIAINTKTGRMNGAGVGDALSFLVFGTCTSL